MQGNPDKNVHQKHWNLENEVKRKLVMPRIKSLSHAQHIKTFKSIHTFIAGRIPDSVTDDSVSNFDKLFKSSSLVSEPNFFVFGEPPGSPSLKDELVLNLSAYVENLRGRVIVVVLGESVLLSPMVPLVPSDKDVAVVDKCSGIDNGTSCEVTSFVRKFG